MIWLLYIFFVVLQLLDALTTLHILKMGGKELNPIMNWLFKVFGTPTNAFIVKVFVVSIIGVFLTVLAPKMLIFVIDVYALVILWNVYQIYKLKTRK